MTSTLEPDQELNSAVDMRQLGSSLQMLRKKQNMTMVELSKGTGVSQSYISEIEAGKAMPSLSVLYSLAQRLGTTPVNLLRSVTDEVEVNVISSREGTKYPIHTSTHGGHFRAILSLGSISVTEFVATEHDSIEGDFEHAGVELVYIAEGSLQITVGNDDPVVLEEGDVMTYPGEIAHSWKAIGPGRVRVLQVLDTPDFPQFTHPLGTNRDVEPEITP